MRNFLSPLAAFAFLLAANQIATGHALQPGYLELQRIDEERWRMLWRKPDVNGRPMPIEAGLPDHCSPATPPGSANDGSAWVSRWIAICPGGLEGGTISIEGLAATQTDVLVRYEPGAGDIRSQRLTPDAASFQIEAEPTRFGIFHSYFWLGVDHILGGIDHLLFVFALLLLIADYWRLLGAITAFTVAHSITLAGASLGYVSLPGPPVEAVIALSIMFLAYELVERDESRSRLSERYPWMISFAFGLLHGFGFAGALQEIGLPRTDVPVALLSFNLGVEAGQIVFVGAVLLAGIAFAKLMRKTHDQFLKAGAYPALVVAYVIGGTSAYWFIERLAGFV